MSGNLNKQPMGAVTVDGFVSRLQEDVNHSSLDQDGQEIGVKHPGKFQNKRDPALHCLTTAKNKLPVTPGLRLVGSMGLICWFLFRTTRI